MKIALISDIHFGKDSRTKEFSVPGEEVFDETTGAVSLEQGLIDVLKANEAEYLFIAGDLYDQEYIRESTIEFINNLFKTKAD